MKRALAFFGSVGAAVVVLAILAQPAHTQGTLGPAPLVNVTTGGGLTKTGQKVGITPCSTNEIQKWNGTAWACAADSSGGAEVVQTVSSTGTIDNLSLNASTTILKFTGASSATLRGLTGGSDGRIVKIDNSSSSTVSFAHDNAGSTAANRIFTPLNITHTLFDNEATFLVYSSTDSRWHLGKFEYVAGTGITLSNNAFTANLAGASCSAGNFVSALSATGTGTCTAETGDVSSWAANGNSLSVGGVAGATCSSGACSVNISDRDFGDITAATNGTVWTVDNSTITSAKLNITTTSCSAGNHVSAISAGGVGTCTADAGGITGSLTNGTMPVATGTSTLGDSVITQSGSAITVGGTLSATGNINSNDFVRGVTGVFAGSTYHTFMTNSGTGGFACLYNTNATGTCYFNPVGYNDGTTQFRNLKIQDGKGADVIDIVASTKAVGFAGPITFNAAGNVGNELALSGTFASNGTSTTLSNGSGDQVTIGGGELRDTGSAPSSFTCGTGASAAGGRNWFRVTVGSSPTATCAVTFSTAYGATPTCSVTRGNSSARTDSYISALSTSSMTISNDAGTTLTAGAIFHIRCGG